MKCMQYKGYSGSAEVSVDDDVVFGKLLYIRDLISYEADAPNLLRAAFEAAVDDYLAECEAEGREAERPFKGQFNVRIAPALHRALAISASQNGSSLNEYVETILSCHEHIDRNGHVKPAKTEVTVLLQDTLEPVMFTTVEARRALDIPMNSPRISGTRSSNQGASTVAWYAPVSRVVQ